MATVQGRPLLCGSCSIYTLQLKNAGSTPGDRDDDGPLVDTTRVNLFLNFPFK